MYTDYKIIMDISSSYFAMAGYGIHFLLIIIQFSLIGYLAASAFLNLFPLKKDYSFLRRVGLITDISSDEKKIFAGIKLFLSAMIIMPLIVNGYYIISAIASCAAFFFLSYYEKEILSDNKRKGRFVRYIIIVFALITGSFIFLNRADNLQEGLDIMFKALHYRNEEVAWQLNSDKASPKKGDMAPDFKLSDTTGTRTIQLSEYKNIKPVVLIFGAYT